MRRDGSPPALTPPPLNCLIGSPAPLLEVFSQPMIATLPSCVPGPSPTVGGLPLPWSVPEVWSQPPAIVASTDPDDDEDLVDDDLPVAEPTEDESDFDDFDDEFDDDFEEEENDPDWDHPDESEPEPPAPPKGGKKK